MNIKIVNWSKDNDLAVLMSAIKMYTDSLYDQSPVGVPFKYDHPDQLGAPFEVTKMENGEIVIKYLPLKEDDSSGR